MSCTNWQCNTYTYRQVPNKLISSKERTANDLQGYYGFGGQICGLEEMHITLINLSRVKLWL